MENRGKARIGVPQGLVGNTDFDAVDLSETGIKLRTDRKITRGKKINLLLNLDGAEVLISGEVMWCTESNSIYETGWTAGLQFVEHTITAQLSIRRYVSARLPANNMAQAKLKAKK